MKIRCGQKLHNGFFVPETVVIRKNSKGQDVYISSLTMDAINFRIVGTDEYYSIPYKQSIVNMFKSLN